MWMCVYKFQWSFDCLRQHSIICFEWAWMCVNVVWLSWARYFAHFRQKRTENNKIAELITVRRIKWNGKSCETITVNKTCSGMLLRIWLIVRLLCIMCVSCRSQLMAFTIKRLISTLYHREKHSIEYDIVNNFRFCFTVAHSLCHSIYICNWTIVFDLPHTFIPFHSFIHSFIHSIHIHTSSISCALSFFTYFTHSLALIRSQTT